MEASAEQLAVRARAGDRASLDELVVRYRPQLVAFLARRLPSAADAEDIAQETLMRAFEHLAQYDESRPFATWLFAIGKNVAANHVVSGARRALRERAVPAVIVVEAAPAGDETWQRAAKVLSADSYRALWLRYAQGHSVREVAAALGRSSVAIKVMLFRARRRMLTEVR